MTLNSVNIVMGTLVIWTLFIAIPLVIYTTYRDLKKIDKFSKEMYKLMEAHNEFQENIERLHKEIIEFIEMCKRNSGQK